MVLSSVRSKAFVALLTMMSALPACGSSDSDVPIANRASAGADPETTPTIEATSNPDPPAPPAPPGPPPLGGEVGKWTWLDVPESMCGNGEPTGIGVNIGTGSELLIFLEGGGACWDEFSCAGIVGTGIASNIRDGYTKEKFEKNYSGPQTNSIFDRTLESNPFKTASFIVVPYCTGDVYSGDATQKWNFPPRTMHYAGRKNIEAYLAKVAPAFKDASRVTMSGSSAGGFGAALNYWRVKEAFGDKRVDLIDDSGPPFEQSKIPLLNTWRSAWNMEGVFPAGCTECNTNIATLTNYYATTYPSSRFSFLSYDLDNIISLIFVSSQQQFSQNMKSVLESRIKPLPNWRYFVVPGSSHTTLYNMTLESGGVSVGAWLGRMTSDSPDWSNIAPY